MEATQRLNVSSEEEDDDLAREMFHTTVFGRLTVLSDNREQSEQTYDIFGGENKIGRDPEQARIVLDNKSLSRTHAVIEVSRDGTILLYDDHSMNGTLRNGSKLKPGVHYAMNGNESLSFGDVQARFIPVGSGELMPVENTNGSIRFVPEAPAAAPNADFSTSSPWVCVLSPDRDTLSSSPETPEKTADESSVFIAPSQPVGAFTRPRPHETEMESSNKPEEVFKIPESQPYRPELEEETQNETQTEAFGTATMGLMEMETQQFQSNEGPPVSNIEVDQEEEKTPNNSQSSVPESAPKHKEGYEAEAPQIDEDEFENTDDEEAPKSDSNKTAATEILSPVAEDRNPPGANQANVETQLFTVDLAMHANDIINESTEGIETMSHKLDHEENSVVCEDRQMNTEKEEEKEANHPSLSPTHSSEMFEVATQLDFDDTRADSINLNFDDSSRNSSDISNIESFDKDIFESSPKHLSMDVNESLNGSNNSGTLLEDLDQNEMESNLREPSPYLERLSSSSPVREEIQDEYVECYHGATQLIAESNTDFERKPPMGKDEANYESEDDFIASSQVSGPDRTNFVTKTMSLTIVRESSPNTNDVSLSQIEESDLDSEVDESEIKSSQGDLKMQTSECDQFDLPSIPGSATGILDSSTPVENDQEEKAEQQERPISVASSGNGRVFSEDDSEKFLESTQALMEFQNAATCSKEISGVNSASKDITPSKNDKILGEVWDSEDQKSSKTEHSNSKVENTIEEEKASSHTTLHCDPDTTEKFGSPSVTQVKQTTLTGVDDGHREEDKLIEIGSEQKVNMELVNIEAGQEEETESIKSEAGEEEKNDLDKIEATRDKENEFHKVDAVQKEEDELIKDEAVQKEEIEAEINVDDNKDPEASHHVPVSELKPEIASHIHSKITTKASIKVPGFSSEECKRSDDKKIDVGEDNSANEKVEMEMSRTPQLASPASEIPTTDMDSDTRRTSTESTGLAETDRKSPSLKVNRRCRQTPTKIDTTINESGIDPVIAQRHIDMSDKPKPGGSRSRRSRHSTVNESLPIVKPPSRPGRKGKASLNVSFKTNEASDLQAIDDKDCSGKATKTGNKRLLSTPSEVPTKKEAQKLDENSQTQETNGRKVRHASKKTPVEMDGKVDSSNVMRGRRSGGSSQSELSKSEANETTLKLGQSKTGTGVEIVVAPLVTESLPIKRGRGRPSKTSMLSTSSDVSIEKAGVPEQVDKKSTGWIKSDQNSEAATNPDVVVKRRGRPPSKSPKHQNLVPYSPVKGSQNSEPELKPKLTKRFRQGNQGSLETSNENLELESPPSKKGKRASNPKPSGAKNVSNFSESTTDVPSRRRGRPRNTDRQSDSTVVKTESTWLDEEPPKPKRGRPSKTMKEEPVEPSSDTKTYGRKIPLKKVKEEPDDPENVPQKTRSTRASMVSASTFETTTATEPKRKRGQKLIDGISAAETSETEVLSRPVKSQEEEKKTRGRARSELKKQDLVVVKEEEESSPEKKFKQAAATTKTVEQAKRGKGRKSQESSEPSPSPSSRGRKFDTVRMQDASMMEICRARMSVSASSVESGHSGSRPKHKPVVMFTGFESKQFEKTVKDLGGTLTTSPSSCTVLVTDKVRRTVKFLCAIGRGVPVVSQQWLVACKAAKIFLDPWNHVLVDEESEKKWGFRLRSSLEAARRIKLLEDFSVYATKKCVPTPTELKEIIECAGGKWLKTIPTAANSKTFAVSCPEDAVEKSKLASKNILVYDKEILLSGLLTQTLDFDKFSM